MAIEQMKLMRIIGDIEQFDALSAKLCESACFQPDPAGKYISSPMGFVPFGEENPYTAKLAELTDFANTSGFTLQAAEISGSDAVNPDDDAYIKTVEKAAADLYEERTALLEQKTVCEEGIRKYEHFKGLNLDLDSVADC